MTSVAHPDRVAPSALWLALPATLAACFLLYLSIATLIVMLMMEFAETPQEPGRSVLAAPVTGAILALALAPLMFRLSRRSARTATVFLLMCGCVCAWIYS